MIRHALNIRGTALRRGIPTYVLAGIVTEATEPSWSYEQNFSEIADGTLLQDTSNWFRYLISSGDDLVISGGELNVDPNASADEVGWYINQNVVQDAFAVRFRAEFVEGDYPNSASLVLDVIEDASNYTGGPGFGIGFLNAGTIRLVLYHLDGEVRDFARPLPTLSGHLLTWYRDGSEVVLYDHDDDVEIFREDAGGAAPINHLGLVNYNLGTSSIGYLASGSYVQPPPIEAASITLLDEDATTELDTDVTLADGSYQVAATFSNEELPRTLTVQVEATGYQTLSKTITLQTTPMNYRLDFALS